MMNRGLWLLREKSGQGMVEYSLIIALVIIGAIVAVQVLGESALELYDEVVLKMPTA